VGLEKRDLMPYQFEPTDLDVQRRVKHAFDPDARFNPGKVFPLLHRCAEEGRVHVHVGAERFADLPRF
ncbi:MAG: FAD-linked oxidase C-terminal domain-containing protein, partial [Steroidobacteraceae bacterium]